MAGSLFLRAAGYDPAALADYTLDERRPIELLGGTVLLAATVAGANWAAAAAFHFTAGHDLLGRIAAAVAAAAVGAGIVIAIDRAAVYAMDTTVGWAAVVRGLPLLVMRIVLTVTISSVTANAVMPLLMRPELEEHALRLRERSDAVRRTALIEQLDLPQRRRAVVNAEAKVRAAEEDLARRPDTVKALKVVAKRARRAYVGKWVRLRNMGLSRSKIRAGAAWHYRRWQQAKAAAEAAEKSYREKAARALADANVALDAARKAARETQSEFAARVASAAAIEQRAITPESARVMESLLSERPKLFVKYVGITALITLIELLALLTKFFTPASVPGARIAADRDAAVARHRARRECDASEANADRTEAVARARLRRHRARVEANADRTEAVARARLRRHRARGEADAAIEGATMLRRRVTRLMKRTSASPEFEAQLEASFATRLAALVPFEVFRSIMGELESRAADKTELIRRFPDHARFIWEAFEQAVEDADAILRHAARPAT